MKKTLLMTSMWIAAGAVATGGTTAAMALAGGNSESAVLSQADVRARADAARPTTPAPSPSTGRKLAYRTSVHPPAIVAVRCQRGAVTNYSVIPKTGWKVVEARIAPLPTANREIGLITTLEHKTLGTHHLFIGCSSEKVAVKLK